MAMTFTFTNVPMPVIRIAEGRAPIYVEFDNWRVVVDPDRVMPYEIRRYAAALVASAIIKNQIVPMEFGELPQLDELRRMAELECRSVDFNKFFNLPPGTKEIDPWPPSWLRIEPARN